MYLISELSGFKFSKFTTSQLLHKLTPTLPIAYQKAVTIQERVKTSFTMARVTKRQKSQKAKRLPKSQALAANNTKTFHGFKKLPAELRIKIWKLSMSRPRIIELYPLRSSPPAYQIGFTNPAPLFACYESRIIGLSIFTRVLQQTSTRPLYFNFARDSLLLSLSEPAEAVQEMIDTMEDAPASEFRAFLNRLEFVMTAGAASRSDWRFLEGLERVGEVAVVNRRLSGGEGGRAAPKTVKAWVKRERALRTDVAYQNDLTYFQAMGWNQMADGMTLVGEAFLQKLKFLKWVEFDKKALEGLGR